MRGSPGRAWGAMCAQPACASMQRCAGDTCVCVCEGVRTYARVWGGGGGGAASGYRCCPDPPPLPQIHRKARRLHACMDRRACGPAPHLGAPPAPRPLPAPPLRPPPRPLLLAEPLPRAAPASDAGPPPVLLVASARPPAAAGGAGPGARHWLPPPLLRCSMHTPRGHGRRRGAAAAALQGAAAAGNAAADAAAQRVLERASSTLEGDIRAAGLKGGTPRQRPGRPAPRAGGYTQEGCLATTVRRPLVDTGGSSAQSNELRGARGEPRPRCEAAVRQCSNAFHSPDIVQTALQARGRGKGGWARLSCWSAPPQCTHACPFHGHGVRLQSGSRGKT